MLIKNDGYEASSDMVEMLRMQSNEKKFTQLHAHMIIIV